MSGLLIVSPRSKSVLILAESAVTEVERVSYVLLFVFCALVVFSDFEKSRR